MRDIILVSFEAGQKVAKWEVGDFLYQFQVANQAQQMVRIIVTQPSRDGFSSPVRDCVVKVTDRSNLEEVFTITTYLRMNKEAFAAHAMDVLRNEFFHTPRNLEETSVGLPN